MEIVSEAFKPLVLLDTDTKISEIQYDVDIIANVRGKLRARHFNEIYCKYCNSFIPVKYVEDSAGHHQLITSVNHNKLLYCDGTCRNKDKAKKLKKVKLAEKPVKKVNQIKKSVKVVKTKPPDGFHYTSATQEQKTNFDNYVSRL